MDPELKAEWIAALRSGEFRQGYGKLSQRNSWDDASSYCCLGVLCEIKKDELIAAGISFDHGSSGVLSVGDRDTYPSREVCAVLGLSEEFWHFRFGDEDEYDDYDLDTLNDAEMPFEHIADVIDYIF